MRIEPPAADPNQYGLGMEPTLNEHLVECTELVDGFGSTKTISNREKHMVVPATDEHRRRTSFGERIRKHHAPGESTVGSWIFRLDHPSFLAIERESMAFKTVPSIDRFCVKGQVDLRRRKLNAYDLAVIAQVTATIRDR